MKREIREWHGKELDCRIYFMDNRYGCEVSLRVEGQEFYGSTLSFHEWGMCRFDIAEDAIKFAIANMEDMITLPTRRGCISSFCTMVAMIWHRLL